MPRLSLPLLASCLCLLSLCCLLPCAAAPTVDPHSYAAGADVVLWANKVGPYHNPSETYPYFSIPGCAQVTAGVDLQEQEESLSVYFEGDMLVDTGLRFPFRRDVKYRKLCELALSPEVAEQLEYIVANHFWFHLLLDGLPLFGMVGEYISAPEMESELAALAKKQGQAADSIGSARAQGFIYTHRDYSIAYNGARIVEVNLTNENPRPITVGVSYPLTLSVSWVPSGQPFASRYERYKDFDLFGTQVHAFSLLNSFMLVIFLCGLVLLILSRTIKTSASGGERDAERGSAGAVGALDDGPGESGWKLLVGDVFRPPPHVGSYAAALGSGVQLLVLGVGVLALTVLSDPAAPSSSSADRGVFSLSSLIPYALGSFLGGAVSGWWFKAQGGVGWKGALGLTASAYPAAILAIVLCLNTVASYAGSHVFLPSSTLLALLGSWVGVCVPCTVAGTVWARGHTASSAFPCRVNAIKRLIPSEAPHAASSGGGINSPPSPSPASSLYTNYYVLVAMSGLLPFGAIFIEMYFVFTSFWNYKFYFVYTFLCLVFVILLVVTVCVAIVSTYLLLNAEDYRWHWMAFFASASSCGYIALYSVYYYFYKTHMSGALQFTHFFGGVLAALITLALITGSIGALGTRLFITRIYSYTKAD